MKNIHWKKKIDTFFSTKFITQISFLMKTPINANKSTSFYGWKANKAAIKPGS
jgi:hypothetical protein